MQQGLPAFFQTEEYAVQPEDIVRVFLGCSPDAIQTRVIITPVWGVQPFQEHGEKVELITEGRVWNLYYRNIPITVIRSGIGAPLTGDVVLALGATRCHKLVFCGSVGGLDPQMSIGDLVIVEESLCGDGFSRYLSEKLIPNDSFLTAVHPNAAMTEELKRFALAECDHHSVPLHLGKVFSTDSILAQFFRLNCLWQQYGCNAIEMETAATFKATNLIGIESSALLQISDVLPAKRSFFSGRTEQENIYRKLVRTQILSKIALDLLV